MKRPKLSVSKGSHGSCGFRLASAKKRWKHARTKLRTEALLLAQAFFDDTPEISVDGRPLTASWLHRIQTVFRNALALCQAVRLLNAKALDQQVAGMCLTQPDAALSLTVTTSELLHADRQIGSTLI